MKVLFNPISLSPKKLNRQSIQNKNNNFHINNKPVTDTVSFGSVKNYNEQLLDDVETIFEEQIRPFMRENKELFKQIGVIGYGAQNVMNNAEEVNNKYINDIADMVNPENNKSYQKVQKYVDRADKYSKNVQHFSRILSMSDYDMYASSKELALEIKKTAKIFKDLSEVEKLIPLKNQANIVKTGTSSIFSKNTLENLNPVVYGKIKKASEVKNDAIYYMMMTPYQEASKLENDMQTTRESLGQPKKPWYADSKSIEMLFNDEQKIIKSIDKFNEIRPNIVHFVVENKNAKDFFPTKAEIVNAYDELSKLNKKACDDRFSTVETYFGLYYTKPGKTVDLKKVDKELELQNSALERIDNIMAQIRTDYYAKQNKEAMKNN